MIITLTNTAVDNINALRSIHGKVDIEVNGFKVTHLKLNGAFVDFYRGDKRVCWAKLGTEVSLKVWKEIIK